MYACPSCDAGIPDVLEGCLECGHRLPQLENEALRRAIGRAVELSRVKRGAGTTRSSRERTRLFNGLLVAGVFLLLAQVAARGKKAMTEEKPWQDAMGSQILTVDTKDQLTVRATALIADGAAIKLTGRVTNHSKRPLAHGRFVTLLRNPKGKILGTATGDVRDLAPGAAASYRTRGVLEFPPGTGHLVSWSTRAMEVYWGEAGSN